MTFIRKLARDLALTLYDHPTEFKCMSLARVWASIFGVLLAVTWWREEFYGVRFANWMYLTMAFTSALSAYGLKKWVEKGANSCATGSTGQHPDNG